MQRPLSHQPSTGAGVAVVLDTNGRAIGADRISCRAKRCRTMVLVQQCQSCGMPLRTKKAGDCRGTEGDGGRSEMWCSLCYVGGRFVDPECTLPQMQRIVEASLRRDGRGFLMRRMALRQLPTLERWRDRR